MRKIEGVFREKKALITYIMAGDPDIKTTGEILLTLDRIGVDIIEVGIPFSDPLADGPEIQAAGLRALRNKTGLGDILGFLRGLKGEISSSLLLMGYYNSFYNYGPERFVKEAVAADIAGVIIPDLTFDQDPGFYQLLAEYNLAGIMLTTPVTTEDRLRAIASHSNGFIYCVSRLGVTGTGQGPVHEVREYLARVRRYSELPLALGFGIDGPEKVKQIREYTDGVIIGSAIVRIINNYAGKPAAMLEELTTFIRRIKSVL